MSPSQRDTSEGFKVWLAVIEAEAAEDGERGSEIINRALSQARAEEREADANLLRLTAINLRQKPGTAVQYAADALEQSAAAIIARGKK